MMLANSNVACFAHTVIWQQEQAVFVQSVRIWQSFIQEQLTVLPVPSAEGGIFGEQERELVPLQHLCVSTLFLRKRDSGGVRGKTSSILYCRSLRFLSNGWQAQLTRYTLLSCLSPQQQVCQKLCCYLQLLAGWWGPAESIYPWNFGSVSS